jgi:hypothetical protein
MVQDCGKEMAMATARERETVMEKEMAMEKPTRSILY